MKNKNLLDLKKSLEKLSNHEGSFEYSSFVVKNLRKVNEELDILQRMVKPSVDFQDKYIKPFNKIAEKYCIRDENGNIAYVNGNQYQFSVEQGEEFQKEVLQLESDPVIGELLTKRHKQIEKYNEALERDIEIKLMTIKKQELPEKITPKVLGPILDLVE